MKVCERLDYIFSLDLGEKKPDKEDGDDKRDQDIESSVSCHSCILNILS